MTEIRLDDERLEVPDGAILGDIIPSHPPECSVAVIRPVQTESAATRNIRVTTTAGEVIIELTGAIPPVLQNYITGGTHTGTHPENLILKWADRQAAAFGPFPTDIISKRTPHRYDRGNVILGCGGYDAEKSFLIFSKAPHIADHGAAEDGGIIGTVISGMSVLEDWKPQDAVTAMERIIRSADASNAFTTTRRDIVLEDGMSIITHARARAAGYRDTGEIDTTHAQSVEHLLLTYRTGRYHISLSSGTHVRDDRMRESEVFYEGVPHSRFEGTVTVRVNGRNRGSVFIYTDDIAGSPNHTVVASVEHGIELARIAGADETFLFDVEPPQFDLRGMALSLAQEYAGTRGITLEADDTSGERVVIAQSPETTLEVLAKKAVSVTTIPASQVISVELFDADAPRSCYIFRSVTGLRWHEIGDMPLLMKFDDVLLFQPPIKKGTNINKENTPEHSVPANMLAITNDSRKIAGLVGCRTTENHEFGPTSEPFEGTNIIGRICEPEKLAALKEGSTVYIREVHK